MKTQTEIAIASGVTQQFVSRILMGLSRPSWPVAKRLAEATGTDPVTWIEGTAEEIKAAVTKKDKNDE